VSGVSATEAYLPSEKIAIAVAVTYLKASDLESLERGPTATCPLVGGTSTPPTGGVSRRRPRWAHARRPSANHLTVQAAALGSPSEWRNRHARSDHHLDGTHGAVDADSDLRSAVTPPGRSRPS
jgi:hypothetical protein